MVGGTPCALCLCVLGDTGIPLGDTGTTLAVTRIILGVLGDTGITLGDTGTTLVDIGTTLDVTAITLGVLGVTGITLGLLGDTGITLGVTGVTLTPLLAGTTSVFTCQVQEGNNHIWAGVQEKNPQTSYPRASLPYTAQQDVEISLLSPRTGWKDRAGSGPSRAT